MRCRGAGWHYTAVRLLFDGSVLSVATVELMTGEDVDLDPRIIMDGLDSCLRRRLCWEPVVMWVQRLLGAMSVCE